MYFLVDGKPPEDAAESNQQIFKSGDLAIVNYPQLVAEVDGQFSSAESAHLFAEIAESRTSDADGIIQVELKFLFLTVLSLFAQFKTCFR
jgi:hypothetical protein